MNNNKGSRKKFGQRFIFFLRGEDRERFNQAVKDSGCDCLSDWIRQTLRKECERLTRR